MEICSDDEDYQDLSAGQSPNIQSIISDPIQNQQPPKKLYTVSIVPIQSSTQANFFQKQLYSVSIKKDGVTHLNDINRRYSDFDILFQGLMREYHGYILPAFPQKDLISFVKSKVSIAKDQNFLKSRMQMIQRFLTILINSKKFSQESCPEIQKFLCDEEFDLFKKQQKINSPGFLASSWNKLISYTKWSKESRYKIYSEETLQDKKQFYTLFQSVKQMHNLIQSQIAQYTSFSEKNYKFDKYGLYCSFVQKVGGWQRENIEQLADLEFDLECLNYDYLMVLKQIDSIQELRNTEMSTNELNEIDTVFEQSFQKFKKQKKIQFKVAHQAFCKILKAIKNKDESFRKQSPLLGA